jgi:hypothetical protein
MKVTFFKSLAIASTALSLSMTSAGVQAQERHEHGHADVELSLDGPTLVWDWHIPSEAIVGFEHAPSTDQEQATWRQAESDLRDASRWLHTNAQAKCRLESVQLQWPMAPAKASASMAAQLKHEHAGGESGHSDIDWEVTMRCEQPAALNTIGVSLFSRWPRLRQVHVQAVTARGQVSGELKAAQTQMRLP